MPVKSENPTDPGTAAEWMRLSSIGNRLPFDWTSNAHVHLPPNFSAFESVGQAVKLASDQKVKVLGASNYYDFEVYGEFASEAHRFGLYPLFGLEIIAIIPELQERGLLINDPGNPGRMYICGKGIGRFKPMTLAAEDLMQRIRSNDSNRIKEMIGRLETIFAEADIRTGLREETIRDAIVRKYGVSREQVCLQERHVAQAYQEALFSVTTPLERIGKLNRVLGVPSKAPENPVRVQGEIRTYLMKVGKKAYVAEQFLSFDDAVRLILELGGMPSYPTLADGASPICPYETPVEKLVQTLGQSGVYCAEFIPVRNEPSVLEHYVRAMRSAGFVVTGGTEHNTLDLIPLEPRCLRGMPVPQDIRDIFSEGACVVAAHQFLTARGECGYVGRDGALNPGFSDTQSRIAYFRGLGAALVAGYHEQSAN